MRDCLVCRHKARKKIEHALINRTMSRCEIARRYHISTKTLYRHIRHMVNVEELLAGGQNNHALSDPEDCKAERGTADVIRALLQRVEVFMGLAEARALLGDVEGLRIPPVYYRELRETYRLLQEIDGKLPTQGATTVTINQVWIDMRAIIMKATEGYPEVRERIARELAKHGVSD